MKSVQKKWHCGVLWNTRAKCRVSEGGGREDTEEIERERERERRGEEEREREREKRERGGGRRERI